MPSLDNEPYKMHNGIAQKYHRLGRITVIILPKVFIKLYNFTELHNLKFLKKLYSCSLILQNKRYAALSLDNGPIPFKNTFLI